MNIESSPPKNHPSPPEAILDQVAREYYGGELPPFQSNPHPQPFPFNKIGHTADGIFVRDRKDSHFHSEDGLSPEIVKAAVASITAHNRNYIEKQIHFDHSIGTTQCVETTPDDTIISVYRKGRSLPIPMALGRSPEPCNVLSIALQRVVVKRGKKRSQPEYRLVTAFVGEHTIKTPNDPNITSKSELKRSIDFWNTHALAFNPNIIDWDKTLTHLKTLP